MARNILAWLAYQGFHVVRDGLEQEEPLPIVESRFPVVFDSARKIVVLLSEDSPMKARDAERRGGRTGAS